MHGPCGIAANFEILEFSGEKRCWSWRVRVVGITIDMVHSVDPVRDAGKNASSTTLEIAGPAPIVLGYLPIARIALGRLVR